MAGIIIGPYILDLSLEGEFVSSPIVNTKEGFRDILKYNDGQIQEYLTKELLFIKNRFRIDIKPDEGLILTPVTFNSEGKYILEAYSHPKIVKGKEYKVYLAEFNLLFFSDIETKFGLAKKGSCISFGIYVLTDGEHTYTVKMRHRDLLKISDFDIRTKKIVCNLELESEELGKGEGELTVYYPLNPQPDTNKYKWRIINRWKFTH